MSTELETLQRVQSGLYHLQRGLLPFVEQRMRRKYAQRWAETMSAGDRSGEAPRNLDSYALLKPMVDKWRDVFSGAFKRNDQPLARSYVTFSFAARNHAFHEAQTEPVRDSDALRYLDAMFNLLLLIAPESDEVARVRTLYDAQRGLAPTASIANQHASIQDGAVESPSPSADQTNSPGRRLRVRAPEDGALPRSRLRMRAQ